MLRRHTSQRVSTTGAAPRVRRAVRRGALLRLAFVVVAAGSLVTPIDGQSHAAGPHQHPEAQAVQPPFASSPSSIESGRAVYARLCASCHGPYGLGNGRLAAGVAAYGPRPSDFTDDVWQHGSSAGEVFVVIRDGIGPEFHMPAFAAKESETDLWNVTHFVKSLSN